jgi:replicative DNA helicase
MSPGVQNPVSPAAVLGNGVSLPENREAEMALLGALIYNNEAIGEVLEVVGSRDCFAYPPHQSAFEIILRCFGERKPVDLIILKDELEKDRLLEACGGIEYFAELVEKTPNTSTDGAVAYAASVRDAFVKRNIIETCQRIIHKAVHVTGDVEEIRNDAEKALFQALAKGEKGTVRTMSDILRETFAQIEDIHDRKSRLLGYPTGYYELDDMLSGLQKGQLYVVAGRPSMGKTSFGLNVLEHIALREGKPVLLFSLEMAAQQIAQSMLCSHAKVDSNQLRTGRITEEEYGKLVMAAGAFHEARIFIDDSADLSALEVRTRARRWKAKEGIELVVVDYLQKMNARQGGKGAESRQLEIAMISSHLKAMAKELNVPVIALAQLNRSVEGREDHKPMMSDLRESGAIEQDADAVMLLYREEYYKPDTEKKGVAEIILSKNRTGPTGNIELAFLRQFTRFENLAAARPA